MTILLIIFFEKIKYHQNMKISSFGGKNWISSPNSCKILGIDERKFEFAVFFMSFNRGRTSKCVSKIWKKHQSFVLSTYNNIYSRSPNEYFHTRTYVYEVQKLVFTTIFISTSKKYFGHAHKYHIYKSVALFKLENLRAPFNLSDIF